MNSAGRTTQIRAEGPLDPREAIRRQMVRCRKIEGVDASPHLPVDRVKQIERKLDCRLPDDILAIAASKTRLFADHYEFRLDFVGEFARRIDEQALEVSAELIPVGREPDGDGLYCIRRDWSERLFIWTVDPKKESSYPQELGNWVEWRINDRIQSLLLGQGGAEAERRAGRVPTADEIEAFTPKLVTS